MRKKNFKVTAVEDGKEYWISPSVIVICIVFVYDGINKYVLANKRGSGAGKCQHMWSLSSGFLDFGETVKDAAVREVYEETGVAIHKSHLKLLGYNDIVEDGQVSFRFLVNLSIDHIDPSTMTPDSKSRGGEDGEVEEVKLIPYEDIDKYQWAFNHLELIKKYYRY